MSPNVAKISQQQQAAARNENSEEFMLKEIEEDPNLSLNLCCSFSSNRFSSCVRLFILPNARQSPSDYLIANDRKTNKLKSLEPQDNNDERLMSKTELLASILWLSVFKHL